MPPRRHHYVPRFYLDRFARNGQIGIVSLGDKRRFVTSTAKAAAETDFYRIEGEAGGSYEIEKALSEVEGNAAAALKALVADGQPLPDQQRADLAYFLSLQVLRGRAERDSVSALYEHLSKTLLADASEDVVRKALREEEGQEPTDDRVQRALAFMGDPERYRVQVDQTTTIAATLGLAADIVPFIAARTWQLMRFEDPVLYTCDVPVSLWSPREQRDSFYGIGLGTASELRFPVDRRHALVLAIEAPSGERVVAGTSEQAEAMNGSTRRSAYRWIFHHPDRSPFPSEDTPHARPVARISGLGPEHISGGRGTAAQ